MKKLFIVFSLILYIFGSSYVVHATTMVLPYMEMTETMDMGDCSHADVQIKSNSNSKDTCLDKCVGAYDELTNLKQISIKDIHHIYTYLLDIDPVFVVSNLKYIIKNNFPPGESGPYFWYVGQITVLLI